MSALGQKQTFTVNALTATSWISRLPWRGQWLAFLDHIHREDRCGAVTHLNLVHDAWPNVPGLTDADWFAGWPRQGR